MPDVPRRQQILETLLARCQVIRTENGFATDAGLLIFLGEAFELGADDPDVALAIVPMDDEPTFQGVGFNIRLPIDMRALAKADLEQPWIAVEAVLGDIKRAIEVEDRRLINAEGRPLVEHPGLERRTTHALPRGAGSLTVGAGILYVAAYREGWGAP